LDTHRESASLRSWLLAIAANEARQLVRRGGRRALKEIPVDETLHALEVPGADWATRIDIANALSGLPAEDRALLALRYVADLDSNEIAGLLGGSPSGVRSRLARLLHRLREDLSDA
jgi:RNA polymerase sigma-70 factor (ECF subfamily)